MTRYFIIIAASLLAIPAAGVAQDKLPSSGATALVRQFETVCLATGNDLSRIRALAEADRWQVVDPATLPAKSSVSIQRTKRGKPERIARTNAWRVASGDLELLIGLIELPAPHKSRCEIMAYGDDADDRFSPDLVDRNIVGLSGIAKNQPLFPGLPMKTYMAKPANVQITYISSDAGTRLLHYIFTN